MDLHGVCYVFLSALFGSIDKCFTISRFVSFTEFQIGTIISGCICATFQVGGGGRSQPNTRSGTSSQGGSSRRKKRKGRRQ